MHLKLIVFIFLGLFTQLGFAQTQSADSVSLLFIGDIMGHEPQIKSAYDASTQTYNYDAVFSKVAPIFAEVDFTIANLEVTLGGAPYTGYPQFSSPDALAVACKNSGIDVLVTANNHSCDRGKSGILKTLGVLDSLDLKHTGTFKDETDREENNLLVLEKNNIRIGILNYTYGTNGIAVPAPTKVNLIENELILRDIEKSKAALLDKLIVFLHWGNEYESQPAQKQVELAEFLFNNSVDIIIGSHPHVLQKMEYFEQTEKDAEKLIAYSLGNFVSNQRTRKRDGGAMIRLTVTKENNNVKISNAGYYLTWVNKYYANGKNNYEIIPCSGFDADKMDNLSSSALETLKIFASDSRKLFDAENRQVNEIKAESGNN
jgi:poly-gamma-glutamate synthesis protein (capsule biosynthesis protein)